MTADPLSPAEQAFRDLQRSPRAYRLWADEVRRQWRARDLSETTQETTP